MRRNWVILTRRSVKSCADEGWKTVYTVRVKAGKEGKKKCAERLYIHRMKNESLPTGCPILDTDQISSDKRPITFSTSPFYCRVPSRIPYDVCLNRSFSSCDDHFSSLTRPCQKCDFLHQTSPPFSIQLIHYQRFFFTSCTSVSKVPPTHSSRCHTSPTPFFHLLILTIHDVAHHYRSSSTNRTSTFFVSPSNTSFFSESATPLHHSHPHALFLLFVLMQ
jgi:hypothetical protein